MSKKKSLLMNLLVLLAYFLTANPGLTGIAIHEWLGIGVLIALFMHCVMHVDWVRSVIVDYKVSSKASKCNLFLGALLLVAFVTVIVSGFCISGAVLPTFGLFFEGYFFWDPLHVISAKVLLALVFIHIILHWKWLLGLKRRGKEKSDERFNAAKQGEI